MSMMISSCICQRVLEKNNAIAIIFIFNLLLIQSFSNTSNFQYGKNQKFGLLEALLTVGAWEHAQSVISRLPTYFAVCQVPIAKALAKLIHISMQPVHEK